MSHLENLADYNYIQRYDSWKLAFNSGCNILGSQPPGPDDIYLFDAFNRLERWEEEIKKYRGEHKTDRFHDFHDYKSKLLIKLDSVDVSGKPKRNATRLDVYLRLSQLTKQLEDKIHQSHSNCPECVQVKVVMLKL